MPFGISIADFKRLGDFSLDVYRQCRDCPGQYRGLASETRQLSNLFTDLGDLVEQRKVPEDKYPELLERGNFCKELLETLEELVQKYNSSSAQEKRQLDSQGLGEIQGRLFSNITLLNALSSSLLLSTRVQVHDAVSLLVSDYLGGHREPLSRGPLGSNELNWQQLVHDLGDFGITEELANENRPFIVDEVLRSNRRASAPSTIDDAPSSATPSPVPSLATTDKAGSSSTTCASKDSELDLPSMADNAGPSRKSSHLEPSLQVNDRPPSYEEASNPAPEIRTIVQEVVEAWNARQWTSAMSSLRDLVEIINHAGFTDSGPHQLDIRMVNHLMGIASSFQGNYTAATSHFELNLKTTFANGSQFAALDRAELAALRWLGDTCVMLRHVKSAALAYSIALETQPAHNALLAKPTNIDLELRALNDLTSCVNSLSGNFEYRNQDPTIILADMDFDAKVQAVNWAKHRIYRSREQVVSPRAALDLAITEETFFVKTNQTGPWPLPWDPFFRVVEAGHLARLTRTKFLNLDLNTYRETIPHTLPGQSKQLLHVTKKDVAWLIEALKRCLETHGIEYGVENDVIKCVLAQRQDGIAYNEIVEVKLRKVSLRGGWGVKVAEKSDHQTRTMRRVEWAAVANQSTAHKEIASLLKADLERQDV